MLFLKILSRTRRLQTRSLRVETYGLVSDEFLKFARMAERTSHKTSLAMEGYCLTAHTKLILMVTLFFAFV